MNSDVVKSFVAHIISGVAAATGMLLFIGISQGDVTALGASLQKIGDGVVSIAVGISAIIPLVGGIYGAIKQTTKFTLQKLDADPEIEKVKAVPGTETAKIAATISGSKVT